MLRTFKINLSIMLMNGINPFSFWLMDSKVYFTFSCVTLFYIKNLISHI